MLSCKYFPEGLFTVWVHVTRNINGRTKEQILFLLFRRDKLFDVSCWIYGALLLDLWVVLLDQSNSHFKSILLQGVRGTWRKTIYWHPLHLEKALLCALLPTRDFIILPNNTQLFLSLPQLSFFFFFLSFITVLGKLLKLIRGI